MFVVDHTAVFDKIVTEPAYQRRGLGSFIMKALAAQAFEHDVEDRAAAGLPGRAEAVFAPGLDHGVPRADAVRLG